MFRSKTKSRCSRRNLAPEPGIVARGHAGRVDAGQAFHGLVPSRGSRSDHWSSTCIAIEVHTQGCGAVRLASLPAAAGPQGPSADASGPIAVFSGGDRFVTFRKWPKHVRDQESNCPLTWAFRVFYHPH
jgi:hypothetical protein